jgi:hypothetical protein
VGEVRDEWRWVLVYWIGEEEWQVRDTIQEYDVHPDPYAYRFPSFEMAKQFLHTHQEILDKIKHAVIF